jgi:copper chaperone
MDKVLTVRGMTCGHCKASVEGALRRLAGVSQVDVDLASGRVKVTFDEARVGEVALKHAIEDVGFDVG